MTSSPFFAFLILLFITNDKLNAQTFYTYQSGKITKIENGDPSDFRVIKWQYRLYKSGVATSGNDYWGTVDGASTENAKEKLVASQKFELDFNQFMGRGRVPDNPLTHFNALGPIAVLEEEEQRTAQETANGEYRELLDVLEEHWTVFSEIQDLLHRITFGADATPFDHTGQVFAEYTDNIRDVFEYTRQLKGMLNAVTDKTLPQLTKKIATIYESIDKIPVSARKVLAAVPQKESASSSTVTKKGFYVFLTTRFLLSGKSTLFISAPVWCSKTIGDDLENEKRQFLHQVNARFKNRWKKEIDNLTTSNVEVHYAKPNATQLMLDEQSVYHAISSWKETVAELLDGIATWEFYQLD